MAVHSRKDFAVMCGLEPRELSVYAKRKKVLIVKKMVDDQNPINAEFLKKRILHNDGQKVEVVIKEKLKKGEIDKEDEETLESVQDYTKLSAEKRKLETDHLRENIHLLRLKKEKMEGILVPTELVRKIFEQHFRSVTISFQRGAENIIIEFSKKKSYPAKKPFKSRKK